MTSRNQTSSLGRCAGRKLIDAFPGRVVRKDLVQRLKVGFSIPVYVLEYLLGKYCSTTDESQIDSGLANVKEMIKERIVRSDQSELIKARLQRFRSMKLIDMVTVTFDEKDQGGKYWAKLATSGLDKVHIDERIVYQYERTLTGGVWANLELAFDESIVHGGVTTALRLEADAADPDRQRQPGRIHQGAPAVHPRRMGRRADAHAWATSRPGRSSHGGGSCFTCCALCRWSSGTTT